MCILTLSVQVSTDRVSSPAAVRRDLSLDVLRAVAIFLVMGRHMPEQDPSSSVTGSMLIMWQRGGWIGVDLFFVLSGFLISGLLFSEVQRYGAIQFKRFFIRRGFKIYPPFYFLIAVTVIQGLALGGSVPLDRLAAEVFYLQNYLEPIWDHTWSLAVEEHFYLLLPLILFLMMGAKKDSTSALRKFPAVCMIVAVFCLMARIANSFRTFTYDTHLAPTHLRIDSLLFGCFISYYFHFARERFERFRRNRRGLLAAVGVACLLPAFFWTIETRFIHTLGFTIFFIGSGLLLISVLGSGHHGITTSALGWIGRYSYSIYLWHLAARIWLVPAIELKLGYRLPASVALIAYLVLACVAGFLMARMIEFPALAVRDRLFPSRSRAEAAAPAPG